MTEEKSIIKFVAPSQFQLLGDKYLRCLHLGCANIEVYVNSSNTITTIIINPWHRRKHSVYKHRFQKNRDHGKRPFNYVGYAD